MTDYRRNRVPGGTYFFMVHDERDYATHMDYVHFNPVKHALTTHVADWPFASFRHCVAAGLYPDGWCGNDDEPSVAGESR